MKWLLAPLLWLLALGLVVVVLWRLWRGKPMVLHGRWTPRVVRMVAIVLVMLGVGQDRAAAQAPAVKGPTPRSPDLAAEPPPVVSIDTVSRWLSLSASNSLWTQYKQRHTRIQLDARADKQTLANAHTYLAGVPPLLTRILKADLEAMAEGKLPAVVPVRDLVATLEQAEKLGYYDQWLAAYVWRLAGRSEGDDAVRIDLHRRLAWHGCVTNGLIRSRPKQVQGLAPVAWRGKGGGMRGIQVGYNLPQIQNTVAKQFRPDDWGTWTREGGIALTVARTSAVPTLHQGSQKVRLDPGTNFRFHRLDLLTSTAGENGIALEHAVYGKIAIPAGKLTSVWELPRHLSDDARKRVEAEVDRAMSGDEEAARRLETALPLVHARIRSQLAARPTAEGAGRLRLILALFDDVVMPRFEMGTQAVVVPVEAQGRGGR